MDQALNSQKTPHTSPLRASYGMSFVSILMKNDRVIKGFYCIWIPKSQKEFDPLFICDSYVGCADVSIIGSMAMSIVSYSIRYSPTILSGFV